MNSKKGFTLIELLIVIAIIGILAGTVIVSLSGNTDDASDASIKLGIAGLRTAAVSQQYKTGAKNSGNAICTEVRKNIKSGDVSDTWTGSDACSAENNATTGICCKSEANTWMLWAKISGNKYHCIDSTGTNEDISLATDNSAVLDLTNVDCTKPSS